MHLITTTTIINNNSADGIPLSSPYHWTSNTDTTSSIINKIDDLINSINQVNFTLKRNVNENVQFEHFMYGLLGLTRSPVVANKHIENKNDIHSYYNYSDSSRTFNTLCFFSTKHNIFYVLSNQMKE
jgi:hypothetical protein